MLPIGLVIHKHLIDAFIARKGIANIIHEGGIVCGGLGACIWRGPRAWMHTTTDKESRLSRVPDGVVCQQGVQVVLVQTSCGHGCTTGEDGSGEEQGGLEG